jgi:uncharacterized protein YjbJ (UPF0337 family)
MSAWDKVKARWDQLLGRAEELYGETHGDAAAEIHGEALQIEADVEEGDVEAAAEEEEHLGHGPAAEQLNRPDDDVTGSR